MDEKQIEDIIQFVKAARIIKYEPPCAITAMMTTYDVDELTEEQLVKEALELSDWLHQSSATK